MCDNEESNTLNTLQKLVLYPSTNFRILKPLFRARQGQLEDSFRLRYVLQFCTNTSMKNRGRQKHGAYSIKNQELMLSDENL